MVINFVCFALIQWYMFLVFLQKIANLKLLFIVLFGGKYIKFIAINTFVQRLWEIFCSIF